MKTFYSSFIVSYFTFTINDILDQTCNIYFFKLPCVIALLETLIISSECYS